MLAGVAQHSLERLAGMRCRNEDRGEDKEQPSQSCRDQVENIVEARCCQAKGAITGGAVANHRIHRIDGLVD